ncbi:MAG: hypothetical protein CUN55_01210 [Phototrophicales bacterium]|nr:MAG: hypothetical protein CUN55_01210 [Phototrophicales bacterium]
MFKESQLNYLSALIEARTGLDTFTRYRQTLIEALQQDHIENLDAYIAHLELLDHSHPVWQALLNDLIIGETYFMRDQQQISLLRELVLPAIIQQKRHTTRQIRIWSAGCATGEEAYTLAILLYELLPDHNKWDILILGTDINWAAIQVAQKGIYKAWSFRNTTPTFQQKYFIPRANAYEIRSDLRHNVRFEQANLVSVNVPQQDLIVCRNVLFYFTPSQAAVAEKRLLQCLQPSGWLLLSPAETLHHTRQHFEIHTHAQTIVFRRRAESTTSASYLPQPLIQNLEDIYQSAVEAFQTHQFELAEIYLNQISHLQIPKIACLQASLALSKGDWDGARVKLNETLHLDPFWAEAHYLLGLWHIHHDDLIAAYTSLRAAIYSEPRFALAYLLKGDLMMKQGDYNRATRAWETARQLALAFDINAYLSDIADVTAGQLINLVEHRLN